MPELIVRILGDASQLERTYKKAAQDSAKFSKGVERAGRGATVATVGFKGLGRSVAFASGAFLGAAGLTAAVKGSVEAASNLSEQISKTNVVFGQSAQGVEDWSEASARAMGLAQDQALATVSSFGALFRPMGLIGEQAAQQSEQLTQLGADLASFYNTDVQSALDAIRSGLVGESEPLRQYGVLLSETRVQAEALTETHKRSARELTDQEKVLARIALIYKDTARAQGDFARTQGGLANQTRILKANLRDLAATVGGPVGSGLEVEFRGWNKILGAVNRLGDAQERVKLAPEELRVVVPRLAGEYQRLRDAGFGVAEVHKRIVAEFADAKHGADLLGAALDYIVNPQMRANVAKLQHSIEGVGLAAEDAAKATSMIGVGIAHAAAAAAAAAPRGEAALGPGGRLRLALDRARLTPSTADDLKVLVQQRELYATQVRSLQNRLAHATGKKAQDLAAQLEQILENDIAAFGEITAIQQQNADAAQAAAKKIADAAKKRAAADKKIAHANVEAASARIKATNTAAVAQAKAIDARGRVLKQQRLTAEQRQQFRALGLTATGEERIPGVAADRRRLEQLRKAVTGTSQDTAKTRGMFASIGKLLAGEWGKVTRDSLRAVDDYFDQIAQKLGSGADKVAVAVAPKMGKLLAGLDLNAGQRRRLEFNLAGQHLIMGPGANVGAGVTVHNHLRVDLDGRQVEAVVRARAVRAQQRAATQTTGRQTR